ncbi:hypothetical protein DH2020_000736 [Rehmannia glutinosa]|uniref:Uncharacterized protein n=1 Tax=Rehmannia glutinosa TaxID=99300 RepID=A0ABR0XXC1_REHGL
MSGSGTKGKETLVAPDGVEVTPGISGSTPEGSLLNTPGVRPLGLSWIEPLDRPEGVTQQREEALREDRKEEKWEEILKEVSELKQRVSGKEVVRRGIPFRASVMADELPANFRSLTYKYDGTTDPWEHLQLPADSIASFGEFSSAFLHQFASSRKHQKTSLTLFRVKQSEGEPLRYYVKKFTATALEVPSANQEILTSALTQGLKEGDFFRSLAKRPARDFDDVLSRAEKYVNLEEAQKGKKEELRDKRKERVEVHRDVAPKRFWEQERRAGLVPRVGEPRAYTPLVASRDQRGVSPSHNDALFITATIGNFDVARIMVDMGSSVNVFFYEAYLRMGVEMEVKPVETALFGFGGGVVEPIGQKENEEPDMMSVKPQEELKSVELVAGDSTKVTRIGTQLGPELATAITSFLRENLDVFAWSAEDLGGVDPEQVNLERGSCIWTDLLRNRVGRHSTNQPKRGIFTSGPLIMMREYGGNRKGMRMVVNTGVKSLRAYSDSMLVTHQVSGDFEVREEKMERFVRIVGELAKQFTLFKLEQFPREENVKADHLSKIASSTMDCGADWRNDIRKYLAQSILPEEKRKASRIQARALGYCLIGGVLYKRAFSQPFLRYLSKEEGAYVLHEGACGSHGGSRLLAQKARRAGYFWRGLKEDAHKVVKTCEKCKKHGPLIHKPAELLGVMSSPCPFAKWGIDIVGPFPMASRQRKFLVVAKWTISKKWVEANPWQKSQRQHDGFHPELYSKSVWLAEDLVSDNGTQLWQKN